MPTQQVRLPDLGEGLTEATVVRWLVSVGDTVTEDQIVAEVETAKATVELPTPHAGTVTALLADEGDEIEVGAPVLAIDPGDGDAAPGGAPRTGTAATASGADDAGADDVSADDDGSGQRDASDGGDLLVGYGADHASTRRRRGRVRHGSTSTRPRAKPPVRKLAKDLGVDLREVAGSGPSGRITRDDVRAAAQQVAADQRAAVPAERTGVAAPGQHREPVTGVRARIADHLSVAWREIPAASCWVQCDATRLLAVRDEVAAAYPDVPLTPLAFILRCCAVALREVPHLNATFDADAREIVHHERVDLGVATQTDRGLMVPVVRDAAERSVRDLAGEVRRLADGARAGTLAPTDLVGSTFTVSNVGAFGIDGGAPIINHPEAGILGVGRIAPRPWVVGGDVVARPVVALSLSFDHRVCDGAEAAGFLRLVADLVERPALLLGH